MDLHKRGEEMEEPGTTELQFKEVAKGGPEAQRNLF